MKNTQIRPSQFITTFGVEAIVDGPLGSCIILDYRDGYPNYSEGKSPEEKYILFPINSSRIAKRIRYTIENVSDGQNFRISGDGKLRLGIMALPTNAEDHLEENKAIYYLKKFPAWALCNKHPQNQVLYSRSNHISKFHGVCPICVQEGRRIANYQGDKEVIRFVKICPKGHIDDIDWYAMIHKNTPCSNHEYFLWVDKGSELRFVEIKCPVCLNKTTLDDIIFSHQNSNTCNGRRPHSLNQHKINPKDPIDIREECCCPTQVIQRTASSVFIPEVVTSISLPDEATSFYKVLLWEPINLWLKIKKNKHPDKIYPIEKIQEKIQEMEAAGKEGATKFLEIVQNITKTNDKNIIQNANNIIAKFGEEIIKDQPPIMDEKTVRRGEFELFSDPNLKTLNLESTFKIGKRESIAYKDLIFSVLPVLSLEVVMVQIGYKRLCNFSNTARINENCDCSITTYQTPYIDHDGNTWFIGVRLQGEGIFIGLDNNNASNERIAEKLGTSESKWLNFWELSQRENIGEVINSEEKSWLEKLTGRNLDAISHPIGIWWHTLSHRIIKSLSLDCGYSSASIRERIYFDEQTNRGGVLLYAARPGEDGTLGGLVTQANKDHFEHILHNALDDIDLCSNDPLCSEHTYDIGSINGAACFACLFLSETSCEFGNTGLDRNLLRITLTN